MTWTFGAAVALLSYLLGSIPFGWIIARANQIDIRQHGSGNIGATNVLRILGKPWGYAVFALDVMKGFAAVELAISVALRSADLKPHVDYFAITAAIFAVVGHSFPMWLGFRGGKGVATSAGALLAVMPIATLVMLVIWVVVFYTTRYVSLASIIAALALPISAGVLVWTRKTNETALFYFAIAMTALVVWRHRSNMSRLLRGNEPRFARK